MSMARALRQQAAACANLGSPFMRQLLLVLSDSWRDTGPVADYCRRFDGNPGADGASLPLRLAGALHAIVLANADEELVAVYPPDQVTDSGLERVVWRAIARNEAQILDWMRSAPQTNEVRRSAVLIPAAHWIAARHPLPIVTSEPGASAGLNLAWDRFALDTPAGRLGPADPVLTLTPDWEGPLPAARPVTVVKRAGVDLNPLDTDDADQRRRLMAYLWPDQPHRAELTRAAIAGKIGTVDKGDAIDWLENRLKTPYPGHLHLIYNTVAWQYFPKAAQARGTRMIEAAGTTATPDAPIAWLQFEADGSAPGGGIALRLWPGDHRIILGRADYHGRWVRWAPQSR